MSAGSLTDLLAHGARLVVRTPGSWSVAPDDARDVVAIALDGLVEELETSDGFVAGEAELPSATKLQPIAAFVGRVVERRLEIEGSDGEPLRLDAIDVRIIDNINEPICFGEVVAGVRSVLGATAPDLGELSARVQRIAATGRIRLERMPPEDVPADVDVTTEPEKQPDDAAIRSSSGWTRGFVQRLLGGLFGADRSQSASVGSFADESLVEADRSDEDRGGTGSAILAVDPEQPDEPEGQATFQSPPLVDYIDDVVPTDWRSGPVPVYGLWQVETGPALSIGMLTAAARHHDDGRLLDWYEIRRPEHPESILADLEGRSGPAVLLCSDYVWSLEHNLEVARRARAVCPELLVVHGGPSTPKYEQDCAAFLEQHAEIAHVAVRGEGEATICELLAALGPTLPEADLDALRNVPGLTYRSGATGGIIRTEDRERTASLNDLPSPYLTGEFDHLAPSAWDASPTADLTLETNRGCPYGCTFCDWGSATLSRIRKFDIERIDAEMRWAASRGIHGWNLADANFGIMSRDVEIADRMGQVKAEHGLPTSLGFNVAKNTTKHLTAIIDLLVTANIDPYFTLALQTRDEATLDAVDRKNISTDHYVSLAADFRRRLLPLQADLMIGLPGQTVDSFSDDLQFMIDHEIMARMWIAKMLPNAPMNAPEYRETFDLVANDDHIVISSSTFSNDEREEMMAIRHAYVAFEQFGILRHIMRYAQWDHGVSAMTVLRRIIDVTRAAPSEYPLLNWVNRYFDYYNVPPVGWRSFFAEVERFLADQFDIPSSVALDTVVAVQSFLLPEADRAFPASIELPHDYVAYRNERMTGLWLDGRTTEGHRPLTDFGPGELTVRADPTDRCGDGLCVTHDPRNEFMQEGYWLEGNWELDSPLVANLPMVAGSGAFAGLGAQVPPDLERLLVEADAKGDPLGAGATQSVTLRSTSPAPVD